MQIGIGIDIGYATRAKKYFHDDFNRADNAASVGNGWALFARTATPASLMGILNGQAYVSQNPTFEVISYQDTGLGSKDIAVSCVFPHTDLTSGLIARFAVPYNDQQTFYAFGFDNVDAPALYKVVSGSYTKLGGTQTGSAIPDGCQVRMEIRGTSIKVYLNGELIITATDNTPITAGPGVGMRNGNTVAGHWDEFEYEEL